VNTRAIVAITVAIATAVALAGCTASPPHPSSRPSTAAPFSSPSATAPTRPALADLVVTSHGIGDITLGEPVPVDDPAVAIVRWDPTACVTQGGLTEGEPYAGLWRSNYPAVGPHGEDAFIIVTSDGTRDAPVSYVGVREPSAVHTKPGVTVGSSLDELKAAYPTGFAQSAHGRNGADVYAVGDSSGMIAFDVSAPYPDDPAGWPSGDLDKVIGMNVFVPTPGVPNVPNYGTTNSGFCPD
jgi:hypothetical protein